MNNFRYATINDSILTIESFLHIIFKHSKL